MTRRTIRTAACSAIALAAALAAAPAAAQSFQGTPAVTFGNATVTESAGITDVQVDSTSAVIDWTPDDNAINNGVPILFQPAGTTATFHNNPTSQNDFALLNRINPADATRAIIFDGTVISRLQTSLGQVAGGTVFFYSPGGIVVGANAVFDVGNLGLTTAAPVVDGNGNWYVGNQVQFQQAASTSKINIDGQITASAEGSYVAAFAPFVDVAGVGGSVGSIDVNGQVALVAGEAGTITFSPDGLFDIQVTIGSDGNQDGTGVFVDGEITGPASSGPGDNHRIYMVAMPKNTALSIAFGRGASVGFDVAGAADTVGNAVILSAGRNVVGDAFVESSRIAGGDIDINDSSTGSTAAGIDFTSQVTAVASDTVHLDVFRQTNFASNAIFVGDNTVEAFVTAIPGDSTGSLAVGGNFVLDAAFGNFAGATEDSGVALLFASDGGTVDVAGNLTVRAAGTNDRNGDGVVEGGTAQLNLNGGNVDVGGTLLVQTSGFNDTGVDVVGGNSQINLTAGSALTVNGVLRLDSNGIAGLNSGQMGAGGDGTGGFSGLSVTDGSSFTTNELNVTADGVGGADIGAGGGTGTGGIAQISAAGAGSSLTVLSPNTTGTFGFGERDLLSAEAFGGQTSLAGGAGGAAVGGTANIFGSAGAQIALPNDPLLGRILARGTGGRVTDSGTGGDATGGTINLTLDGATMTAENLLLSSFAPAGGALSGATGVVNGGNSIGGARNIALINGATFTGSIPGGGPGAQGGDGSASGTGGTGTGGHANLTVDNSTLNVSALGFLSFTQNSGGGGGTGGDASGGTSFAQIVNGGVVNLASGARLGIFAGNFASLGLIPSTVSGGNATGGSATLLVQNGTIAGPGIVEVVATGSGGNVIEGQGGNGTGGSATLDLAGANVDIDQLTVLANGNGGSADPNLVSPAATPAPGNGGTGTGGSAVIRATGGTSTLRFNAIDFGADGNGGAAAGSSGNGGDATGGFATLDVLSGATLNVFGSFEISSNANGGDALVFDASFNPVAIGNGGNAFGGTARILVAGTATFDGDVEVDSEADGGFGMVGGNAVAGSARVRAQGGTIGFGGSLFIDTNADGGTGAVTGGNAEGSFDSLTQVNAFLWADSGGAISVAGITEVITEIIGGNGGAGGAGGEAAGGQTLILAQTNTASSLPSRITLNDLFAVASAEGGNGGSVTTGNGGRGGDAFAGSVGVFAQAGNGQLTVNGLLQASATGAGGFGGDGEVGGAGGDGTGGFVQVGTGSGAASATNDGFARFTDVTAISSGIGGDGGQGSLFAGGDGGGGTGGAVTLIARGSLVELNDAQLLSFGGGGAGGAGATTDGVGGDGRIFSNVTETVGGPVTEAVDVLVTGRFENPAHRGTLDAGTVNGQALAQGGLGSANGASVLASPGVGLVVRDSDVTVDSLSLAAIADAVEATAPDRIEIKNADVVIGSFSFFTPNDLVLDLDTATLTAADYLTDTRSIQLPATAPAIAGTVIATNSFGIFTDIGSDTLTYVNFDVATGINFNNPGNFQSGDLTADGDIIMTTAGNLVTGNITSAGQIALTTDGDQTVGNVTSGGGTSFNVDGALIAGQIQTGGDFDTLVDGNQTIGDVVAGGQVDIRGMSNITVGSIIAGASVYVLADGGDLVTGNITAGDPANTDGRRFGIGLRGGAVTTGNLSTAGTIISAAVASNMLIGNTTAGGSILLFGAGNIATGSLAGGTDAGETVYIGGTDNLARLGAGDDFQPIIAVDPSPTGGSVTLGGPVSADRVLVSAGGLAAVNGMVTAPFVQFLSGDIAIGSSGGIDAGTGQVRLVSSNSSGMFVGDGGSGGYTLSNTEFGQVRGSEIFIAGVDGSSAIDMTIGNLAISGNQTGPEGTVVFATGDLATMTPSGGIRVDGEVVATNQTADNYLEFYANLIEVNAQSGGIRSYRGSAPSGTTGPGFNDLGGIVLLEANHIHVASDEILLQLRSDPFYSGHADDLNRPGTIDRPNGVLTALGIEFYPGQTLYIQNTGSASNPAGFYTTLDNSDIDPFEFGDGESTPEVEVVINGRFASASGDVSGQQAYQLIIDNAESLDGFSGASQVNGCSFDTGACGPPVPEQENAPPPTNAAEIQVLTESQSEEEPFATEEEEEDAEQAASAPIAPPVVLINTSPLNPDVDVTDPVSGTGNPALIGASISQAAQGDPQ